MTIQLEIRDGNPDWWLSPDIWVVPGADPAAPPGARSKSCASSNPRHGLWSMSATVCTNAICTVAAIRKFSSSICPRVRPAMRKGR